MCLHTHSFSQITLPPLCLCVRAGWLLFLSPSNLRLSIFTTQQTEGAERRGDEEDGNDVDALGDEAMEIKNGIGIGIGIG